MTAVLVEATEPNNAPPRVDIELSGADGATVTILRVDNAGNVAPVRTANPGALAGGGWVGYDYEAPYGVECVYHATTDTGDTAVSDTVVLNVWAPWLIHPGIPDLSIPLNVVSFGPRTRDTNVGSHIVLERADPVVITDGVRHSPSFDLIVATETLEQEAALTELLEDAGTYLLQGRWAEIRRNRYWWVSIGQTSEEDLTDWLGNDEVNWTLPMTVTSAPSGLLQAQRTLGTLATDFATLGDIGDGMGGGAYTTLRDIVIDNRTGV